MNDEKKLCEEIIWWAKFLVAHGINPKIVCEDKDAMAKYEVKDE